MLRLREASASDAADLTSLALSSKAHWGYSAAFMAACRDELTLTPGDCASGGVVVAVDDGALAGFYRIDGEPPEGELVHLFVSPDLMGRGVGRLLLDGAREHARSLGFTALGLDADPHAEAFYARFGARTVQLVPSGSVPGRLLPQMVIDL